MTQHAQHAGGSHAARRFRRLYLVALSVIAALAIGGQILVQYSLSNRLGDGHVVNKAGYQRMLSQRIALKVMLHDPTAPDNLAQVSAITAMRDRWLGAHQELSDRVNRIAYDDASRQTLRSLLAEAARPLRRIAALVTRFADAGNLTAAERAALMADQELFLPLMDAVVLGFERSVHARVTFLQRTEILLLLVTLLALALEAALVFRPAVNRLQSSLDQLARRNRQATRRLESLQHLAGGLAHSFNNIMTGIMGNAGLERIDALQQGRNTEYIDAQIHGCRRAAKIITQLVTYSGHGQYDCEPIALGPWLKEIVKTWPVGDHAVGLSIQGKEDLVAQVDQVAFKQALDGLVTNALEAMEGFKGAVTINLSQIMLTEPKLMSGPYRIELPHGLYALIQIIDQGKGIIPEELERIFDPYYTSKEFGRGLGLAAILGIIHGHGGGIGVESRFGRGCTVSVFLPLTGDEAKKEPTSPKTTVFKRPPP